MTLRQALGELERQGLLIRSKGRYGGTFVAERKLELAGTSALSDQLRDLGLAPGARVLSAVERAAEPHERALGKRVYAIERVRLANGEPVALERGAYACDLFPGLIDEPLDGSLYDVIRARYAGCAGARRRTARAGTRAAEGRGGARDRGGRPGDARRAHGLRGERPPRRDLPRRLPRRPHPDRVGDGHRMTGAIVFDFNGTLSDDEPIMCAIFIELFAAHGRPLTAKEYFDQLAGLSDPEIVRTWLGADHPDVDAVIAERINRYRAAVGRRLLPFTSTCARRCATRAERVPLAICSGAARAEIEPVVEAAGLADCFRAIVVGR